MSDTPQNQYTNRRKQRPAVFLTGAGRKYRRNVTVARTNKAGTNFEEIPAGTVIGKWKGDGLHYPIAKDAAQSAVSGGNDVQVGMVDQFRVGDRVELPKSVAKGADRFRKVTAVDRDNGTITLGGAAFSLSQGDTIVVDRTRSHDAVQDAGTTTANQVNVSDASIFEKGDPLDIGPATGGATLQLPDGSYSGTVSVTLEIFDPDGDLLLAADAEFEASTSTEDTIMADLAGQLDDQLSNYDDGNLGSVSTSAGPPATIELTLADPNNEFRYSWSDNEISGSIPATEDDSTAVKVTAVDEGNDKLTLDKTLTFSNGEQIVSEPDGDYRITERTVHTSAMDHTPQNVLVATNDHGVVDESTLLGLTDAAREALNAHIRFTQA